MNTFGLRLPIDNTDIFGNEVIYDFPIDITPIIVVDEDKPTTGNDTPQTVNNSNPVSVNEDTEPSVIIKDDTKTVVIGRNTTTVNLPENTDSMEQKIKTFIEENPLIALGGLALIIYFVFIKD